MPNTSITRTQGTPTNAKKWTISYWAKYTGLTTGQWYPTKSGYSMPADEVSSLIPLLETAGEQVAKRFVWNTQLELELEK